MVSEAEQHLADKGYLTAAAFADYLRDCKSIFAVSYGTLRRLIDEGKVEAVKVGSQHRILKEEVERYLREGAREEGDKPSSQLRLGSQPPTV